MAPQADDILQSSLPGLWKYPTYRKELVKYAELWMEGKKIDDNTDGLWRVHDGLYDFTEWVYKHPGGSYWLSVTKVYPTEFCIAQQDLKYYFLSIFSNSKNICILHKI